MVSSREIELSPQHFESQAKWDRVWAIYLIAESVTNNWARGILAVTHCWRLADIPLLSSLITSWSVRSSISLHIARANSHEAVGLCQWGWSFGKAACIVPQRTNLSLDHKYWWQGLLAFWVPVFLLAYRIKVPRPTSLLSSRQSRILTHSNMWTLREPPHHYWFGYWEPRSKLVPADLHSKKELEVASDLWRVEAEHRYRLP